MKVAATIIMIWCLAVVTMSIVPASNSYASASTDYFRPGGVTDIDEVVGGYRALFTCSAHFVAGRTLEQILDIELRDTASLELPPPEIDERRQLVTAVGTQGDEYIAVYRKSMGCVLLPPDWTSADIVRLPHVSMPDAPNLDDVDFPRGDRVRFSLTRAQQRVLDAAFDRKTHGDGNITAAVIVLRGTTVLAEQYGNGFSVHTGYRTWSTAKSVSATLIGIAIRDGLMRLDENPTIPEWQFGNDPRRAITLRHLFNMSSGLEGGGNNTNAVYFGGQDVISAVTGTRLEAEPGTRWKYANNDTLLMLRALRATLADDYRYLRYPYDELFHRIGMHHTRMETDHAGNFIGSSQVYTTARDLARFGILYLNEGVWNGVRLLPEGWTEFVATSAPARPRKSGERGYGGQFWLLDTMAGIPQGTYTSAGNKGQYVTIIPERNMVVVRTGVDPLGSRYEHEALLRAILEVF